MIYIKNRLDTLLLGIGLFTLTGAVLCYNIVSLGDDGISDAVAVFAKVDGNYLSTAADVFLSKDEDVIEKEETELLLPIIQPN